MNILYLYRCPQTFVHIVNIKYTLFTQYVMLFDWWERSKSLHVMLNKNYRIPFSSFFFLYFHTLTSCVLFILYSFTMLNYFSSILSVCCSERQTLHSCDTLSHVLSRKSFCPFFSVIITLNTARSLRWPCWRWWCMLAPVGTWRWWGSCWGRWTERPWWSWTALLCLWKELRPEWMLRLLPTSTWLLI